MRRAVSAFAVAALLACGPRAWAVDAAAPAEAASSAAGDASTALEAQVERLRQESEALKERIAALEARLREVPSADDDPVRFGLAALVVLLLVAVSALLWRLARQRSDEAWFEESRALTTQRPSEAAPHAPVAPPSFDEVTASSMRVVAETEDDPGTIGEAPPAAVAPQPFTTAPSAQSLPRALTPEELVDLEQQADFFMAIGQEESAIDVLMAHVRSSGGANPLPYLKLLEIYRRRGEPRAYERIRERFNRRFNAHAPEWTVDPARGHALEDEPDVLERVLAAWPAPSRAVELLEALLFRRGAEHAPFDLTAYEELLFLLTIARDELAHDRGEGGVDIVLPLEPGGAPQAITPAAEPAPPRPGLDLPLDIDLDAPPPPPRRS